jgi:hypothetical protein
MTMIWRALLIEQARHDSAIAEALAATFGTLVDRVWIVDDAVGEQGPPCDRTDILAERRPMSGSAELVVDVYLVDTAVERRAATTDDVELVRMLARCLDTAILTDNDDLDPSGFLRVGPDGSVESVHLDDDQLDEGIVAVVRPGASRSNVA